MTKRLAWIVGILIVFGLIMLSSAGVVEGQKRFGDPNYFIRHQFLFGVLPGLVTMYLFSRLNYQFWRKISLFFLVSAFILTALVFLPGFGIVLNGARSWLSFGGYTFQPVEVLKLALIVYLAAWCCGRDERVRKWSYGITPFLIVMGVAGALLIFQPDIGGLILISAIGLGVYFLAGVPMRDLAIVVMVGLVVVAGMVALEPYRLNRIKVFIDPSIDPRGISYQVNQSLIAIGSGGLFGVGYGDSTQKTGFLPEAIGDSIFAIIAEELGLVGSLFVVGLFLALCNTLVIIAKRSGDRFGRLYVLGVTVWITSQAFVNMAAVSGVAPLTGLPLPFISYGGTAMITLLAALGIVFNVAKQSE